jgi:hypothetical protein
MDGKRNRQKKDNEKFRPGAYLFGIERKKPPGFQVSLKVGAGAPCGEQASAYQ